MKKGQKVFPVKIEGRTLARTFWGKAWCDHLESFSDYANRLPRGRTYVRNGSVVHLQVDHGKIEALVQGSSLYKVHIVINALDAKKWTDILKNCSGQIDSVIELLQGRFSSGVMKSMIDRHNGLFPLPKEIALKCSCPDWATMCKHVAAVLYGVGNRLDLEPELLFKLRNVDHMELVNKASIKTTLARPAKGKMIEEGDLSEIFGIDISAGAKRKPTKVRRGDEKKISP
ncbi:MAG: SWIM zinc finger family protein [Candidatus Omnitrophica bacterium]|nr:SWIM zinc finger family protein [Candidatus Omnitrophota bacterium]